MSLTTVAAYLKSGARTARPLDHRKLGMWLFIGSEVMFFAGFIAAYVHFKVIDPEASHVLDVPLTTLNSFLLLTSSFTVVSALEAIRRNDIRTMWNYLVATWFLGLAFLMGQALEFSKLAYEGITLNSIFGSTFFSVTGFHGFHVFIGLVWLLWVLARTMRRQIVGAGQAMQVEIFGLYWHFVDVVWIFLFAIIYLIR
jgi:cytochrome c oxidase subunit 3